MADNIAATYPTSVSPGNPDQQFSQHQYAYQAQVNSAGGQFYGGASGIEHQVQENVDQQVHMNQGQDYAH
jgi:hypothetical protein